MSVIKTLRLDTDNSSGGSINILMNNNKIRISSDGDDLTDFYFHLSIDDWEIIKNFISDELNNINI
jgi:hypothetical protein